MQNINVEVVDKAQGNGQELVLTIDLECEGELSQSGKSVVVAKTSGFTPVDGAPEFAINLNVIRKKSGAWRRTEGVR